MLGCREEELTAMQKADAVEFFHKQKIKGTHAEIEAACAPYGYHPLSLRLLAGRILKDFENPADIVVAKKLIIDGDLKQHQHHVLEVSYNSLPSHGQKLLSTIACFLSPVELKTLQSITENKNSLDDDLHDLVGRGLLHFDEKNKRFDLHPIVRHYSYDLFLNKEETHKKLAEYFQKLTEKDIPEEYRDLPENLSRLLMTEKTISAKTLDDLTAVIELYHHILQGGDFISALRLYSGRIRRSLYFQFGAYQTITELLQPLFHDEDKFSHNHQLEKAWILNELGKAYGMNGQPFQAIELLERSLEIYNNLVHLPETAKVFSNLANRYMDIGKLRRAFTVLKHGESLCIKIEDKFLEAVIHRQLGRIKSCFGSWDSAINEFNKSQKLFVERRADQPQSALNSYRAHYEILLKRDLNNPKASSFSPTDFALASLEIDKRVSSSRHPYQRDRIRTYWILGASYLIENRQSDADKCLNGALIMCRGSNSVEIEGRILTDLACLRYDQKNYEEAKSLAEEALLITERCGYVLQGADVNLFLAELTLTLDPSPEGRGKAREYAETALKLAYCDGPPYYYKVAYHEAERFLENLK